MYRPFPHALSSPTSTLLALDVQPTSTLLDLDVHTKRPEMLQFGGH
jgi:hypothetical protein